MGQVRNRKENLKLAFRLCHLNVIQVTLSHKRSSSARICDGILNQTFDFMKVAT